MTDWVRLWHDMPTDPKWRVIARKSGQRIGDVIAVFNFLMVSASANANERGRTQGFDPEDVAAALDLDTADVEAIVTAMQGKVLDGDRLTGWDQRQPKREDNSASRAKKWRAEKKSERTRTHANANERPETDAETESSEDKSSGGKPPRDLESVFWADAKAFLKPKVKGDPGALVQKWLRDRGKPLTMAALNAAQVEHAVDPVAYCEGYFRRQGANGQPQPVVPL